MPSPRTSLIELGFAAVARRSRPLASASDRALVSVVSGFAATWQRGSRLTRRADHGSERARHVRWWSSRNGVSEMPTNTELGQAAGEFQRQRAGRAHTLAAGGWRRWVWQADFGR